MSRGSERGAVLVAVLLLLLTLTAIAHGALRSSTTEERSARLGLAVLRRHAAGTGALVEALAGGIPDEARALAPWSEAVVAGSSPSFPAIAIVWTRLAAESWWIAPVVEGRTDDLGRLVWGMDPAARVAELEAALTTRPGAPVDLRGTVSADTDPPAGTGAWPCEVGGAASVPLAPDRPAWQVLSESPSAGVRLGLLAEGDLSAASRVLPSDLGTPEPVVSLGTCASDLLWNWGDPDGAGPCGSTWAFRSAPEGVALEGGRGQGVLIATGDVTLRGTRFSGLILASGTVSLEGAASVTGAIVAAGGAIVAQDSELRGSPCAATRALGQAVGTWRAAVPVPGSGPFGPG